MKKVMGRILLLIAIATVVWVISAGVTLQVENAAGEELRNVQIHYFRGQSHIDSIRNGTVKTKWLWKIGEGATFKVQWADHSGTLHNATLPVYFTGHTGFETVRIILQPNGKSALKYRNATYMPGST